MPTYNFINDETGETQEVSMKIAELDEFKANNPDLRQIIGTPSFVTDTKGTLTRAGSEWQDHLKRMKKGSGRGNTIKV